MPVRHHCAIDGAGVPQHCAHAVDYWHVAVECCEYDISIIPISHSKSVENKTVRPDLQ